MTAPRTVLVLPERLDAADREALQAANPKAFLILAQGEIPAEPQPQKKAGWLMLVRVLKGLISYGKSAAIFAGPLAVGAAGLVEMGLDEAEQALSGAPETEDWTLDRIRAARAAVADPQT